MRKIAIIGCGMSGLTLAYELKDHADVVVFEKSRGVGGRIASRRYKDLSFDHGAQFFTIQTESFYNFLEPLIKNSQIKRWDADFANLDGKSVIKQYQWDKNYPHYVGVPSMNSIAKFLSKDLDIRLQKTVVSLKKEDLWTLYDDQGNDLGTFDWVISTAPPKQSAEILPKEVSFHKKFEEVKMQGCFSLMLVFPDKSIQKTWDVALVKNSKFSWISWNHTKPGRNAQPSIVALSSNEWADQNIDRDKNDVKKELCKELSEILNVSIEEKAIHSDLHLWRYANLPKQKEANRYLMDSEKQLASCGDWCLHGRIEAAFTSGYELATVLKERLARVQQS